MLIVVSQIHSVKKKSLFSTDSFTLRRSVSEPLSPPFVLFSFQSFTPQIFIYCLQNRQKFPPLVEPKSQHSLASTKLQFLHSLFCSLLLCRRKLLVLFTGPLPGFMLSLHYLVLKALGSARKL